MAIFLVVIIAAMLVAMMRLGGSQTHALIQGLQAARAHWAAQAGLEWGVWSVDNSVAGTCFADATLTIDDYSVAVSCTLPADPQPNELGEQIWRYHVTAVATPTGLGVDDTDYAYKQLQGTFLVKD